MSSRLKPKLIAGTVAGLAVAGGGAAYAETQLGSPQQENQAVLNDAATQLESGKSLADVAKAQGKTVDGLVQALVNAAKKKIDAAVTADRLTQTQADSILADLKSRVTDFVNGAAPRFGLRHGFRDGAPPTAGFAGPGI